jgi:FkbM family methyltransferase
MNRHERATIEYLRSSLKPGDVFVDVGAHVGYYAAYAGRLVGRTGSVFAFEPFPSNYKLLSRNCRHMPHIKSIQAAVSDSSGEALLFEHATSNSSHAFTDLSGSGKTIPVRKVTLDEWAYESEVHRVDVVLIDVEGHELSVLRGMRHIIANNLNIIIIMEYCPSNWTSRREEMDALINEMHKAQLYVIRALGQMREYAIPEYKSGADLSDRLAVILDEETNGERCDYVNIVASRS